MAWYNTYRPQTFDDVIGQELVKTVLQNALKKDKIKHAYLLNGPKGVGKTTLARIYANELNDIKNHPESKIDIVEMDAASNTGIDDIRLLIESAKVPPMIGKYKVYIIDEVHMLSKNAMNALLKILEEPPSYIIFLLATTNPEKLIPTVLSRLTKLNLSAHTEKDIIARLQYIAQKEGIKIDQEALKVLAKRSGGSQRDAINLMETVSAYDLENYDKNNTAELLGLLPETLLENIATKILGGQFDRDLVDMVEKTGQDGDTMVIQLLEFLLDTSLGGDIRFDSIIMPIANLIQAKLPIISASGALALIQVSLKDTPIVRPSSVAKQSLTPPTIQPKQEIKPVVFTDNVPSKKAEFETPSKSIAQATQEKPETKSEEGSLPELDKNTLSLDLDLVRQIILDLSKAQSSPPIFKILAEDLKVEKVENQAITLSVSNGIFVANLSSEKMQSWIKEQINLKTNGDCRLFIEQRKADEMIEKTKKKPIETIQKSATSEETNIVQEKLEAEIETKKPKSTTKKTAYFYKIYGGLPEEIKDSKMPIYTGEIPNPVSKSAQEESWNENVDDMFDFED